MLHGCFANVVRGSRVRAYVLLVAGSVVFGALGAVFNQFTVTLSPEYFIVAKGLSPTTLRLSAASLGFRSALPLGAICVGAGLLCEARVGFGWRRWLWAYAGTTVVVGLATACGVFLSGCGESSWARLVSPVPP